MVPLIVGKMTWRNVLFTKLVGGRLSLPLVPSSESWGAVPQAPSHVGSVEPLDVSSGSLLGPLVGSEVGAVLVVGAVVVGGVVVEGALDVGSGVVGGLPVAGVVGGVTGGVTEGVVGVDPLGVAVGGTTGAVVDDDAVVVVSVGEGEDAPFPQAFASKRPASKVASNVNLNNRICFITPHVVGGPNKCSGELEPDWCRPRAFGDCVSFRAFVCVCFFRLRISKSACSGKPLRRAVSGDIERACSTWRDRECVCCVGW